MSRNVRGYPRKLSRSQIQRVLDWHTNLERFRRRQGTVAGFAQSLSLSVHQLERALRGDVDGLPLTPPQRRQITRWGARRRRFWSQQPTARALAQSLGVSRSTLFLCISKKGSYKTAHQSRDRRLLKGTRSGWLHVRTSLLHSWGRISVDDESAANVPSPTPRKGGAS
jgi:hypothetical protein